MNDHRERGSAGGGCAAALLAVVALAACGGIFAVLGGGFVYLVRQQVERRQAELQSREHAIMAELEAMRQRDQQLPPGGHAIAIGPSGELFWDHEPTDLPRLRQTLDTLAPPDQRAEIPIHLRPGVGAPQEVIDQILELTADYEEVVDPLPGPSMILAPQPDEEPGTDGKPPASKRP